MDEATGRQGPIVVTGASGQVGTALQRRLAGVPNPVRPVGRGDDLAVALQDAEVLVHLAGTLQPRRPNTYRAANLGTAVASAAALTGSGVDRVVFLSFLTADSASANPYLRAKGLAEQVLVSTGVPTVVLRSGHILGPPAAPGPTATALLARDGRVSVLGPGTQRLTPVVLDDVVDAIAAAALDPTSPVGTFEVAGPDTVTMDELVRLLNPPGVRIRHVPAWLARLLGIVVPSLPRPLVDVLLADAVAGPQAGDDLARFGVTPRSIADVWQPTAVPG